MAEYLPLVPGPLLFATVQTTALDNNGRGKVAYTIPRDARLLDQHIFAAGITFRGGQPDLITNSADLWIKR